jgi:radical SAM enzyme (TIGR01210 family)
MKPNKIQIESLRAVMARPSAWSTPKVIRTLEPDGIGGQVETTTVFLTGAECPFRCSLCDLWKYTSIENTPVGAIPFQLKQVLNPESLKARRWLKLYNASNFFDPRSIPVEDLTTIAELCDPFERVIVENHPRFCDDRMHVFSNAIHGKLEVAMGLETIHPVAMSIMNKGMTLDDFDRAVAKCQSLDIDVRVFVLLHPPGIPMNESIEWTWKTVAYALERHVRHVSIIPVRSGNGWIDKRIEEGEYELPTVAMIRELYKSFDRSQMNPPEPLSFPEQSLPWNSAIEFDLWDSEDWQGGCDDCRESLAKHIARCNRDQKILPQDETEIHCECIV